LEIVVRDRPTWQIHGRDSQARARVWTPEAANNSQTDFNDDLTAAFN